MYIPEFWIGVFTTLLGEAVLLTLMVFTSIITHRDKEVKKDEGDNH